ncbi:MAG: histidinol phosphatase [Verrucomicrobia bacterium]|nr:MAG: histidinol phosphatase [Verrucomicrobiota bacterium]
MFADLHLHSRFSDGTWQPEELAQQARKHGLAAISLTDHDTVEGCPAAAKACEALGVEFIPGTELTAEQRGNEIHILAYCLDIQDARLLSEMRKFQSVRQNRVREIVARLNELRVPLKAEAVFALANCQAPGRPHVARALVQAGLCGSLDEAFERFLKKNRPAFVPKFKMSAADAIALIHHAGGVAVMAHPGLNRSDEVIPSMVEAGLDGIECFHTKHSTVTAEHYLQIADRFRLLVTGGSDCHGISKGVPLIGTVKIPYQHVKKLKERAEKRNAETRNPKSEART